MSAHGAHAGMSAGAAWASARMSLIAGVCTRGSASQALASSATARRERPYRYDRPVDSTSESIRAALPQVRRDRAAREVARRWRSLSGGAATVLACSGGADSTALVLALAGAAPPDRLVVAHVVHDLRPPEQAHADRDFVRVLAASLGLRFEERSVNVPRVGNAEAGARRLRYAALTDVARAHGCGVITTAHHAEDQLETMLLALVRGAGPRGLRGMRPTRTLAEGLGLIRPMLGVARADAERLCTLAGVAWRVDATNADLTRARALLRAKVLPVLEHLRPGAALRAAGAAELLHDASTMIDARVRTVFGDAYNWPREALRAEPAAVVGEGLRRAFARATGGQSNDRLPRRVVEQAVGFIRSGSGEAKVYEWPRGVRVHVWRDRVSVTSPC